MRKKISLALFGIYLCTIASCMYLNIDIAYAASQSEITAETTTEATGPDQDKYNPVAFTERLKKILSEYELPSRIDQIDIARPDDVQFGHHAVEDAATKTKDPVTQEPPVTKIPQNNPPINHTFSNESRYSFDWKGTPIAQSLYAVAKVAGKDIVVNGTLSGNVYMSLHNTTCEKAMDYLSSAFDFNWLVDGNTILVSTSELMQQSKVLAVHYLSDMDKLTKELKALGIDEANIYANSETRTVSVTGTPYQLKAVEQRLSVIDKPISQCLVLAQLIEINHGDKLDLGMQYSLPTYTHTGTTSGRTDSSSFQGNWLEKLTFSASATASKSLSKGKVISRPMVMVMNGQEGEVNFGESVPVLSSNTTSTSTSITFDYKDIGTHLVITPAIDDHTGTISMKIKAEISNISRWVTSGQNTAPQISTRKATTSAQLKSGQSFVIGGLMSVRDLDNLSGIPGLMNLPILGELFKFHSHSREYAEVYIMITPYIVNDQIDPQALLRKVG